MPPRDDRAQLMETLRASSAKVPMPAADPSSQEIAVSELIVRYAHVDAEVLEEAVRRGVEIGEAELREDPHTVVSTGPELVAALEQAAREHDIDVSEESLSQLGFGLQAVFDRGGPDMDAWRAAVDARLHVVPEERREATLADLRRRIAALEEPGPETGPAAFGPGIDPPA